MRVRVRVPEDTRTHVFVLCYTTQPPSIVVIGDIFAIVECMYMREYAHKIVYNVIAVKLGRNSSICLAHTQKGVCWAT